MINIGQFNTLTITRFTDHGAYVDGGEVGEILVPKAYVTKSMRPGDTLDLFVYLDQSERLVATTEQPLATVGDFAYLEVAWVNEHGAFLNCAVPSAKAHYGGGRKLHCLCRHRRRDRSPHGYCQN